MKFLSLLLAVVIFYLSFVPCTDGAEYEKETTFISLHKAQKDNCTDSHDSCSPLCVCSCCGTVLAVVGALEIKGEKNIFAIDFYSYNVKKISSRNTSIWQPPKLTSI